MWRLCADVPWTAARGGLPLLDAQVDGVGHFVDGDTVAALDIAELLAKRRRAGRTVRRIAGHCPFDHGGHVGWQSVFTQVRNRLGDDPQELGHHLLARAAFEGGVPGQRAEQCRAKGIDIRRRRRHRALEHFRRGERR